jgi:hypothetical protein
MNIISCSLLVSAPKSEVFAFLSDLKNMPEWATEFCQSIRHTAEGWMVQTSEEALYADVIADAQTGVIDMLAGPSREWMGLFSHSSDVGARWTDAGYVYFYAGARAGG